MTPERGFEEKKQGYEDCLEDLYHGIREQTPGSPEWVDMLEEMEVVTVKLQYLKIRELLKGGYDHPWTLNKLKAKINCPMLDEGRGCMVQVLENKK